MTPALSAVHVIGRLQDTRERAAHGWPSLALSVAGHPLSGAQARLSEAEAARYAKKPPQPWVLVLTEALVLLEEAREIWGNTPDTMPPAAADLAPCATELRLHLPDARSCWGMNLAWEDPGGLTRPQALCVVHLAVCLARWRADEQRLDAAAARARADLERERQQSTVVAARAIWGGQPKLQPEPVKEMRSLRDLAAVSSAFSDWGDDEES